ncbi:hypothetical protein DWQ67_02930 [Galactobacter caseinivorans]|uniref:Uncharacterized protein n=1 Tax=Galactobacter caseinivorans TaxID=2676123 RepID=A0A496PMN0_9MICC|nr:hypothetical protein DWQ67_02930 [Galactobacter caseinivorans]
MLLVDFDDRAAFGETSVCGGGEFGTGLVLDEDEIVAPNGMLPGQESARWWGTLQWRVMSAATDSHHTRRWPAMRNRMDGSL